MTSAMLSSRIREHTAKLHQQLEQARYLRCLAAKEPPNVVDYRLSLERLYGFMAPLEAMLGEQAGRWPDSLLGQVFRPRCAALARDLGDLGRHGEALPVAQQLQQPEPERSYASLYMLEGARLGSRVISQQLASHNVNLPRRYFDSAWGGTIQWKDFCLQLDSCKKFNDNQLIDALVALYKYMIIWFNQD